MNIFLGPFYTPDQFEVLPAITIRCLRCENPKCGEIHGYDIGLHWMWWGIGMGIHFASDATP